MVALYQVMQLLLSSNVYVCFYLMLNLGKETYLSFFNRFCLSGSMIIWKCYIILICRVYPPFRPSVRPSICLGNFLGIAALVFSKFWHDARNPYEVVHNRTRFSRKKIFAPKIGKMDQKWAKNRVVWIYWNILSLIFTEFVL